MSRFLQRPLLLLAILTILFLPCQQAWAETDDTAQVYIGITHTKLLPLAGPLTYYADQTGANVLLRDTTKPRDPIIFQSGLGVDLFDAIAKHGNFSVVENKNKSEHVPAFLSDLSSVIDFTGGTDGTVDVYFMSAYDRIEMVGFINYDPVNDDFQKPKNLSAAYQAVKKLMTDHSGLRLHFCWLSDKSSPKADQILLDELLQEKFPGRVTIDTVPGDEVTDEMITSVLGHTMPDFVTQEEIVRWDVSGQPPYAFVASPQLITLTFPAGAVPTKITFTPNDNADAAATGMDANTLPSGIDVQATPTGTFAIATPDPDAVQGTNDAQQLASDTQATPTVTFVATATPGPGAEQGADDAQQPASDAQPTPTGTPESMALPDANQDANAQSDTELDPTEAPVDTATSADEQDENALQGLTDPTVIPAPTVTELTLYTAGDGTFWLYLPASVTGGTFHVTYDDPAVAQPFSLYARTFPLHTAELALLDAQSVPVSAGETMTLHNEETHWLIDLRLEDFTAKDLFPQLTVQVHNKDDGALIGTVAAEIAPDPVPMDDGTYRFTATLPALAQSTVGTFELEYMIWDQIRDDVRVSVPYTMENRAPILRQGVEEPVQFDAYFDLPGFDPSVFTNTLNMEDYFQDLDVDDHLIYTSLDSIAQSNERTITLMNGTLTYTATDKADEPLTVTVEARDIPFGEMVSCTFVFNHISARDELEALEALMTSDLPARYENGELTIPVFAEGALELTIPAESFTTLNNIFAFANLSSPAECLRLYANGEPLTTTIEADGTLKATLPIAARQEHDTETVTLKAELVYSTDASHDITSSLFAFSEIKITAKNTPPYLREGTQTAHTTESTSLSGLPGKYNTLPFRQLFGEVIPADFFENAEENETLYYTISVQGGAAQLYVPGKDEPVAYEEKDGQRIFRIDEAAASQPLDLRFAATGDVLVTLGVVDFAGQTADQDVTYSVKLISSFIRTMIIVIIALVVLAAVVTLLLILHRKRMPSFDGCTVSISNARTANDLSSEAFSTLALHPYGKDPVSLSALLVASGQIPLLTCAPSALTHITLQPAGHEGVRVARSGQDAEALDIRVGSQPFDQNPVLKYNEKLTIRTSSGEILCLYISEAR